MKPIGLLALLVYTFGAFGFGAALVGSIGRSKQPRTAADRSGLLMACVCFAWFVLHVAVTMMWLGGARPPWGLQMAVVFLTSAFPPLLMFEAWSEYRKTSLASGTAMAAWPGWALAAMVVSGSLLFSFIGLASSQRLAISPEWTNRLGGIGFSSLFILAAIYCVVLAARSRPARESVREKSARRGVQWMFVVMIAVFLPVLMISLGWFPFEAYAVLLAKSMPLAFLFLGTYHYSRFQFFDLVIKRGLALLMTIVLLALALGINLPWIFALEDEWARPWILAITLVPLVVMLPWFYGKLGGFLDGVWLGRRYTLVQGLKHFIGALHEATNESSLVRIAERELSSVFRAPSSVTLGLGEAPTGFDCIQDVPLRAGKHTRGAIRMGARPRDTPYFSEDLALLESLAEVLSAMLENARLQRKKQEKEQEAQALSLEASRSELKALRAQINPHFLFNALNAIAGLIHKDPLRADRAVERLADVFRYTLRRSDNEWAMLEEELEFVESYLEVEQARFGPRLGVSIDLDDSVRSLRIPTMMVHTLVENAVKHGIAPSREPGRIAIRASRLDGELVVEVANTGADAPTPRRGAASDGGGFGLKNVRERLSGHFGGAARFDLSRDASTGMTVASLRMPLDQLAAERGNPRTDRGRAS